MAHHESTAARVRAGAAGRIEHKTWGQFRSAHHCCVTLWSRVRNRLAFHRESETDLGSSIDRVSRAPAETLRASPKHCHSIFGPGGKDPATILLLHFDGHVDSFAIAVKLQADVRIVNFFDQIAAVQPIEALF